MKKYIIFIILLIAVTATAKRKEYIPGEPWPENGYDLSYYASGINLYVNRFVDNDTLYYLKMEYCRMKEKGEFFFFSFPGAEVDSLLINLLTTQRFQKLKPKTIYIHNYLQRYKEETVFGWLSHYETCKINDTQWTLYKPKKKQKQTFNSQTAAVAYAQQRAPKKKQMTLAEWNYFYESMKMALKFMGGGTESKTLYDKVMQDGGY